PHAHHEHPAKREHGQRGEQREEQIEVDVRHYCTGATLSLYRKAAICVSGAAPALPNPHSWGGHRWLPSAPMVLSKRLETPDLITATVHGLVTPNDHADVIGCIRAAIASVGSVRVLIVLSSFGGWVPDPSIYNEQSWLGE